MARPATVVFDLYRAGCFVLESKQGSEKRSAEVANLLSNTSRNQRIRKGAAQRGTAAWGHRHG